MTNYNNLKQIFDNNIIKDISHIYNSIDKTPNRGYFDKPGIYPNINRYTDMLDIIIHFDYLLYPPNIQLLNYIENNRDTFRGKTMFDFACGLGVLSLFLKRYTGEIYNYDNFSQITKNKTDEFVSRIQNELNIPIDYVTNQINVSDVFLLIGIGYSLDRDIIERLKPEYIIVEKNRNNLSNEKDYKLTFEDTLIEVYDRRHQSN